MAGDVKRKYRVKFIFKGGSSNAWKPQSPGGEGRWGNCRFIFDVNERDYDWLVVLDDVSRILPGQAEVLACPREQTILVTSEPSSVTRYGKAFAAQFGYVLTSQEPWILPHPNGIYSATGNLWFHGSSYDELQTMEPPAKTGTLSTVCSSKRQAHTMHARRYDFTQWLKARLPELEIYGHGVRYIEKKSEALDPYRFHLAIENHLAEHHWTEKLADPFLAFAVPIYCGCPNVHDYFPEESLVTIDLNDFEGAFRTIRRVLDTEGEYERRFEAVREARRRVMDEYNLLAMLDRHISNTPLLPRPDRAEKIYTRRAMRARCPSEFLAFSAWKTGNALQSAAHVLFSGKKTT